uniref:Dynein light chain n=1 Tax=Sparus aurata TaxID=8175 RepID=A0A671W6F1_SPAAU
MVTHASLCEYTIVLFPSTNMSQKSSSFIICLLDEYIPATALCSYDMFRVCYGLIFRFLFFNILSLTFNLCVCLQHTDMPEEMRVETMELCVTACEKFATNNESAAKMIKESMDKKFGSSWHVVIGEGFGFEVTHEVKNLLYMFFGGSLAVCVWKCS